MKEAEIKKRKYFQGQNYAIRLSENHKSRPYLVPIFQEKHDYFLSYFGCFLLKKGCGQRLKGRDRNLTYPNVVSQFWNII